MAMSWVKYVAHPNTLRLGVDLIVSFCVRDWYGFMDSDPNLVRDGFEFWSSRLIEKV